MDFSASADLIAIEEEATRLTAACDRALQTLGGYGYAREYHVERYWREACLMKLAPISQEMALNYVAEHVLGLPRSY